MSNQNFVIQLNFSSEEEFLHLKGVGPKIARKIIEYRHQAGNFLTIHDLARIPGLSYDLILNNLNHLGWNLRSKPANAPIIFESDARKLSGKLNQFVDLIITSPPYWKKRDYGHPDQIGQESSVMEYIKTIIESMNSWIPFMLPHASLFLNIGDTFRNGYLEGIPALLEIEARNHGWKIANRIIWAKGNGIPEPKNFRLASRHEVIFQFVRNRNYYFDIFSLSQHLSKTSNPGDLWKIQQTKSKSNHLAPFPVELVKRIIKLACPEYICTNCKKPYYRILEPSFELDTSRPQAKRALELFKEAGLTTKHFRAIRSMGISDAGKGKVIQKGAGGNAIHVQELALEAKKVLGGYFREFTFAPKQQVGWATCKCNADIMPGTVMDPFMGSKTTIIIAAKLGRNAIGSDLKI